MRSVEALPPYCIDRQSAEGIVAGWIEICRVDAAASKGLDKGYTVIVTVVTDQIKIRRNQRAQIFKESHVNRRQIIQRPYTHRQDMTGGFGCLVGQPFDQVRMN